jgi:hypothetical protein
MPLLHQVCYAKPKASQYIMFHSKIISKLGKNYVSQVYSSSRDDRKNIGILGNIKFRENLNLRKTTIENLPNV